MKKVFLLLAISMWFCNSSYGQNSEFSMAEAVSMLDKPKQQIDPGLRRKGYIFVGKDANGIYTYDKPSNEHKLQFMFMLKKGVVDRLVWNESRNNGQRLMETQIPSGFSEVMRGSSFYEGPRNRILKFDWDGYADAYHITVGHKQD